MNSIIEKIVKQSTSWLNNYSNSDDIVLSTRVRLARNINNAKFPISARKESLLNIISLVDSAAKDTELITNSTLIRINALTDLEKNILLEQRLLSRELLNKANTAGLVVSDNDISIMINEEDHLRIQIISSGFKVEDLWKDISKFESKLSTIIPFAFDPKLGYLTSCPTNVGTGLRASVLLHLPALTLTQNINPIINALQVLKISVRGIFGEGSQNTGNLFQISNQSTLGESENTIISNFIHLIKLLIQVELGEREKLINSNSNFLLNNIGRAYGTLKYSYSISTKEALNSLSMIRLGINIGVIKSIDIDKLNYLFILVQPAHLQEKVKQILTSDQRDIIRAELLRAEFNQTI